jgi:hypothetical protein
MYEKVFRLDESSDLLISIDSFITLYCMPRTACYAKNTDIQLFITLYCMLRTVCHEKASLGELAYRESGVC